MKTSVKLIALGILVMFSLSSCVKHKWVDEENQSPNVGGNGENTDPDMNELNVSEDFSWSTTKSLQINVIVPEAEADEALRVYDRDETELLYIGYANKSGAVQANVAVAANLDAVKVFYGHDRYIPFEIGVEDALIYDYNEDLTSSMKSTKADCGCEGNIYSLSFQYKGKNPTTIHIYEKKRNQQIFFKTNVKPNEIITFTGSGKDGKMDRTIYIHLNGRKHATMHTSCSKKIYLGDEVGDFEITAGKSKNDLPLCSESNECGCEGGLVRMKMRYTGSSEAHIKVYEKKRFKQIYSGTVKPNGEFSFTGTRKDGRLDNTIYIYINNSNNTSIHTSCSVPIKIGDTYGQFRIVEASNKDNLSLCGSIPAVDNEDDSNPNNSGDKGNTTSSLDGTLAFEDLWPSKGDYDFNDLVISYDFSTTKNANEEILNISATFIVYAFGASFHNGFGFELPNVSPDQIIEVTGHQVASSGAYDLASNGLENGQSSATIIVFDDSYNILQHPGEGLGINTVQGAPYVTPDTVKLEIVFNKDGNFASGGAITFSDLNIGKFNPFIVQKQDRSREIHLANYPPTDLADQTVFGTFNDNSAPGQNRYYKSEDNKTWAINIPTLFDHPQEKIDIVRVYLKFAEWAESSGQISSDWYEDKAGYRNMNLLYQVP